MAKVSKSILFAYNKCADLATKWQNILDSYRHKDEKITKEDLDADVFVEVVDNLESTEASKALSAKQGNVLDGKIKSLATNHVGDNSYVDNTILNGLYPIADFPIGTIHVGTNADRQGIYVRISATEWLRFGTLDELINYVDSRKIIIADGNGIDQFEVPINEKFKLIGGVFNAADKSFSVSALSYNSIFVDGNNGDDNSAEFYNSDKPYRTLDSLTTDLMNHSSKGEGLYIVDISNGSTYTSTNLVELDGFNIRSNKNSIWNIDNGLRIKNEWDWVILKGEVRFNISSAYIRTNSVAIGTTAALAGLPLFVNQIVRRISIVHIDGQGMDRGLLRGGFGSSFIQNFVWNEVEIDNQLSMWDISGSSANNSPMIIGKIINNINGTYPSVFGGYTVSPLFIGTYVNNTTSTQNFYNRGYIEIDKIESPNGYVTLGSIGAGFKPTIVLTGSTYDNIIIKGNQGNHTTSSVTITSNGQPITIRQFTNTSTVQPHRGSANGLENLTSIGKLILKNLNILVQDPNGVLNKGFVHWDIRTVSNEISGSSIEMDNVHIDYPNNAPMFYFSANLYSAATFYKYWLVLKGQIVFNNGTGFLFENVSSDAAYFPSARPDELIVHQGATVLREDNTNYANNPNFPTIIYKIDSINQVQN